MAEVLGEAALAFAHAVSRYDAAKGALSTYAALWIRSRVGKSLQRERRNLAALGGRRIDRDQLGAIACRSVAAGEEGGEILAAALAGLDERERWALVRWAKGDSDARTGAAMGLSQSRAQELRSGAKSAAAVAAAVSTRPRLPVRVGPSEGGGGMRCRRPAAAAWTSEGKM